MGDPRRLRKKYDTPMHPWRRENIDAERIITTDYALKNKRELWKMNTILTGFKDRAKRLIAARGEQADKERKQLMQRLERLGLVNAGARLDDILGLNVNSILERRLQSIMFRRGLARTMAQARQFIIHQHVMVGEKSVAAPSYLVSRSEESMIGFSPRSQLSSIDHAERKPIERKAPKKKREVNEGGERGQWGSGSRQRRQSNRPRPAQGKPNVKKPTAKQEEA